MGEFAVVYYVYAHWLLNEGNSLKRGFHGTHGTPSRSATEHGCAVISTIDCSLSQQRIYCSCMTNSKHAVVSGWLLKYTQLSAPTEFICNT